MQTYSHSGAVPVLGALGTIVVGALTAVLGGLAYGYAFYYVPVAYLNVLFTLAFGAGIGFVVAAAATAGKVRSPRFVAIVNLGSTLLGLYVYWGAYLLALAGIDRVGLVAFWPPALLDFGRYLFENGSWGLREGEVVKGGFLAVIWIVETGVIFGLSLTVALHDSRRPFCEACNEWTQRQRGVARLASDGSEPAWTEVLAGDLPSLAAFETADPGARQYVRLDVARCPRCEQSRFLTASAVNVVVDKQGHSSEKQRCLFTNAILTPAQFAVVEACGALYRGRLDEVIDHDDDNASDEDIQPDSPAPTEGNA